MQNYLQDENGNNEEKLDFKKQTNAPEQNRLLTKPHKTMCELKVQSIFIAEKW
ncbi:MAG: hypothetical protein JSW63_02600 [Ignavibacterium sp.]|nr:MAG: hypothetical protein JSW63_02600 [Ignavibacterium sp.]